MPFGGDQSFQLDEPSRTASRAAIATAQEAQARAAEAQALADQALAVANMKISGFGTATATFNGVANGQLTSAQVSDAAGSGLVLGHGALYSGGLPTVYMTDAATNIISQRQTEFNTGQNNHGVFIYSAACLTGVTTDGGATFQGSTLTAPTVIQLQLDVIAPQKEQTP